MGQPDRAAASAPASVGNIGVGFDLLGHSLNGPLDRVQARRRPVAGVRILAIHGADGELPTAIGANTAGRAVQSLLAAQAPSLGIDLVLHKGIPLAAGMGGSAASAVAAAVAANALLPQPLPLDDLYPYCLDGEAVASGARSGDNVGSQLLGGLVIATPNRLLRLPVPADLHCALVRPHLRLTTRQARSVLEPPFALPDIVAQTAALALFLTGCQRQDHALIAEGLQDVLVEPRRAPLIPGFARVKQAAMQAGALGAGISGAGPSLFAWCRGPDAARQVAGAMARGFAAAGLDCSRWTAPVAGGGARLEAA